MYILGQGHRGLQRSQGYPLPLPCLLSDIFERLGYIAALDREERTFIDVVFTLQWWISYARKKGIRFV